MALPINARPPLIKQYWLRTLLFVAAYLILLTLGFRAAHLVYYKGLPENVQSAFATPSIPLEYLVAVNVITGLLVVVCFRLLIDRKSLLSLGFTWKRYEREAATGFLLGPALLGIGSLVLYATGHLQWMDMVWDGQAFWLSFALMLLVALSEEAVFRGYILNNLLEGMNRWMAWIITAMLFALAHTNNTGINGVAMINLLLGGLLLGLNYIFTKNLWFSIFFHFSWNFFQGPVLGYPVSGLKLPALLQQETSNHVLVTGAQFGFEGSIINTALSVVALMALYWAFEKKYGYTVG